MTGSWKNGNLCLTVAKQLAKLLPMVTWNVEEKYSKIFGLTKEISKQNVESVSWVLPAGYENFITGREV